MARPRPPPNFKIRDDSTSNTFNVTSSFGVPNYSSTNLPPIQPSGNIIYDQTTQRIYYSDGSTYTPLQPAGGGGNNVDAFSIILGSDQNIPTGVETRLEGYSAPSPYSSVPEWNLVSGLYTAGSVQKVSFTVNIEWSGGITNLGTRYVRIYINNGAQPVKEDSTQADPSKAIPTSQTTTVTLSLQPGDFVEIRVFQDSGVTVPVTQGYKSGVSGFKIF